MYLNVYKNDKNKKNLLLLHPMLSQGTALKEVYKEFLTEFNIYAVDFSSHGNSNEEFVSLKNEIYSLKEKLNTENVKNFDLIIGHSFGARVALELFQFNDLNLKCVILDGIFLSYTKLTKFIFKSIVLYYSNKCKKNQEKFKKILLNKYSEFGGNIIFNNLLKISNSSFKNLINNSYTFKYIPINEELQKNIYFDYGKNEPHKKQLRIIKKYYKNANCNVFANYGHCGLLTNNSKLYIKIIKERYLNSLK